MTLLIQALLILAGLLLAFYFVARAYVRQPPAVPATNAIVESVRRARANSVFRRLCRLLCRTTDEQYRRFDELLDAAFTAHARREVRSGWPVFPPDDGQASPMLFMRVGYLRGGWVGYHPWHGRYALGLADYGLAFVNTAVAVHELFHLMRHVQGHARFEDEAVAKGWNLIRLSTREEGLVWWKTWNATPVGVVVIASGVFVTLFTLAFCVFMLILALLR